ncbi:MAG: hypothetical protein CM1200mP18_19080 [Gammaproteobacteria bacterium]|nr:MAG: hypothetical protein CM1200mP18_19080 [Gammaproteobacteria bacterium]
MLVPEGNILGLEPGQGFYQLMNQLPWERLAIGIGALGHMDFALAQTLEYVKERKAFGKTIFEFPKKPVLNWPNRKRNLRSRGRSSITVSNFSVMVS